MRDVKRGLNTSMQWAWMETIRRTEHNSQIISELLLQMSLTEVEITIRLHDQSTSHHYYSTSPGNIPLIIFHPSPLKNCFYRSLTIVISTVKIFSINRRLPRRFTNHCMVSPSHFIHKLTDYAAVSVWGWEVEEGASVCVFLLLLKMRSHLTRDCAPLQSLN